MGKKDKRIAELEAEVARLSSAHAASVRDLGASRSEHATLSSECDDLKARVKRASKDAADRKRELADRENRIQELEQQKARSTTEISALKTRVADAEEAARASAEQAEAAAATATAAAAAAAAMAGMSDSEDGEGGEDGGAFDPDKPDLADRMAEAELTRETHSAQLEAVREVSNKMRAELSEERRRREAAEARCDALEEQQGLKAVSHKLREAEQAAHKSGVLLVEQGEKNLKLHDKLQAARSQVSDAKQDIATVRRALIAEIAGEDAEFELYANISFPDLVRLALQGKRNGVSAGAADASGGDGSSGGGDGGGVTELGSSRAAIKALKLDNSKLDGVRKAEAEIKAMRSALQAAQKELGQQRKIAAKARSAEQLLQELKDKNMEMGNRIAREKDRVMGQKDEVRRRDDRIQALSDHIEKLMVHLKHEAAAKAKAAEGQRRAGREVRYLLFLLLFLLCVFVLSGAHPHPSLPPPPPPLTNPLPPQIEQNADHPPQTAQHCADAKESRTRKGDSRAQGRVPHPRGPAAAHGHKIRRAAQQIRLDAITVLQGGQAHPVRGEQAPRQMDDGCRIGRDLECARDW